ASLLKVLVMIAYYKLTETDTDILNKSIVYAGGPTADKNLAMYFKPKETITPGKSYTVDQLIKYMIIDSDNNATSLLVSNLNDIEAINRVCKELGIGKIIKYENTEDVNILSVSDMATLFPIPSSLQTLL